MEGKSDSALEGREIPISARWGDARNLEPVFVDNMHLALINGQ